MWAAISYILLAAGMLEDAYARGFKPDWPKTLTLAAWIIVFTTIASGILIWGVDKHRALQGLAGFAAVEVAGVAIGLYVAWHWMRHKKAERQT